MHDRPDPVSDLRHERDRFVAFAFAAADALLELDSQHVIRYAGGAINSLTGRTPQQLVGTCCLDLVAEPDRALAKAVLGAAPLRNRFGPVNVRLIRGPNEPVRVALFGACLPNRREHVYLALRAARPPATESANGTVSRDGESGLLDRQSLSQLILNALKAEGDQGRAYKMTLLSLAGLDDVKQRLDSAAAGELMVEIAAQLQANSLDGTSAGRLDNEKFGFVHEADLEVAAVEEMIAACARRADPSGRGVTVNATTVALDAGDLSEAERAKALVYMLNRYADTHQDFSIGQLSHGYKLLVDDTHTKMVAFKQTIAAGDVDVLFQPIVELKGRELHHYEALARFNGARADASPAQLIAFAEEVGLIGELDLLMCRRVVEKIRQARDNGDDLRIAVNLSARSLESPAIVDELMIFLAECVSLREQLMFEITESWHIADLEATAKIVRRLRDRGFHICLDDFGAGAAAFHYLRALEVDFVKIDGIYVRESLTKPNGKPFLRSIAALCRDLNIHTVGEMVETEEVAAFLIDAGVRLGQGYLFGRPTMGAIAGRSRRSGD